MSIKQNNSIKENHDEESSRRERFITEAIPLQREYSRRNLQANGVFHKPGMQKMKVIETTLSEQQGKKKYLCAKDSNDNVHIYSPRSNRWFLDEKFQEELRAARGEASSNRTETTLDDIFQTSQEPTKTVDSAHVHTESTPHETISSVTHKVREEIEAIVSHFETAGLLIGHLKGLLKKDIDTLLKQHEALSDEVLGLVTQKEELMKQIEVLKLQKNACIPNDEFPAVTTDNKKDEEEVEEVAGKQGNEDKNKKEISEENEYCEDMEEEITLHFSFSDKLKNRSLPTTLQFKKIISKILSTHSKKQASTILDYHLRQFQLILRFLPTEDSIEDDINKMLTDQQSEADLREEVKKLMKENKVFRESFGPQTYTYYTAKKVFDTLWKWRNEEQDYNYQKEINNNDSNIIEQASNRLIDLINLL